MFEDEKAESLFFEDSVGRDILFFARDVQTLSLSHNAEDVATTARVVEQVAAKIRKECYGDKHQTSRELSPDAFARYEGGRMITGGKASREIAHTKRQIRWPQHVKST